MTAEEDDIMNDKFKGWNKIIHDKCERNDIMDITVINKPPNLDSRDTPPVNTIYTYASFLVPGLHKFLIYDPKTHRAFCKVVVIDHNKQYFFSDQPACIHDKKFKSMKNIKRKYTLRTYWGQSKSG